MLHQIGLHSADDLFASIPEGLRLTRALDTPAALSEIELMAGFERMAETVLMMMMKIEYMITTPRIDARLRPKTAR